MAGQESGFGKLAGKLGGPPTVCSLCHGIFNEHGKSGPQTNISEGMASPIAQCPHHCIVLYLTVYVLTRPTSP